MWTYNGKYDEVGHDILRLSTGISVDFGNYPIQPLSLLIPSNRDETAVIARLKDTVNSIKHSTGPPSCQRQLACTVESFR